MKWLENFTLLVRSSVSTLRERIEDPERMLHQLLIDMEEELERIRDHVAEAIADEIQMGKRTDAARREARQWMDRAGTALGRGEEEIARAALEEKLRAEERAETFEEQYRKQKIETEKLERAVGDLEEKIRAARQKRTLLLARLARADSSARIQRGLDRADRRSAFAQFDRLEERVERAEARCEAEERLSGEDPAADELRREFEGRERGERLRAELEELRHRVGKEGARPAAEPGAQGPGKAK